MNESDIFREEQLRLSVPKTIFHMQHHSHSRPFVLFLLACCSVVMLLQLCTAVSVTQQRNDAASSGTIVEILLNTTNVKSGSFGKLFQRQVVGNILSQPLYVPDVATTSKGKRNVVFVATMASRVYAFDADSPTENEPIWMRTLGPAAHSKPADPKMYTWLGADGICQDQAGIVGTPVIDEASGVMFLVEWKLDGQSNWKFVYHALDMKNGNNVRGTPVELKPKWIDAQNPNNVLYMDASMHFQRASLSFHNGIVWIPFGSYCDIAPYHGWLIGVDAQTSTIKYTWNSTPKCSKGGIWQSHQSISIDEKSGDMFINIADGEYDPSKGCYGNSVVRLDPSSADQNGQLSVKDHFVVSRWQEYLNRDADLGTTGVLLIPNTRLAVIGSKGWSGTQNGVRGPGGMSIMFLLNIDDLGGKSGKFDHYIQAIHTVMHIHGTPIYWHSPDDQHYVYVWAEADALKQFKLQLTSDGLGKLSEQPVHTGSTKLNFPDMPGGFLSISQDQGNGAGSGVLWVSHPRKGFNANGNIAPGTVRAYDPRDVSVELWSSEKNNGTDYPGLHSKFVCPTIANGRVYIASIGANKIDGKAALTAYGLPNVRIEGSAPSAAAAIPCRHLAPAPLHYVVAIVFLLIAIHFFM